MFTKGMTVECVHDDEDKTLVRGALYTVYWSGTGFRRDTGVSPCIRVIEAAPIAPYTKYRADWFRPLQDSRLDVFRAMLVQTPAPVFVHNGDDGA